MKNKQPREFWIKNKANEYTDNQFWATESQEYDSDIHVIEYAALEALKDQLAIAQNAYIDAETEIIRLHAIINKLKTKQETKKL